MARAGFNVALFFLFFVGKKVGNVKRIELFRAASVPSFLGNGEKFGIK